MQHYPHVRIMSDHRLGRVEQGDVMQHSTQRLIELLRHELQQLASAKLRGPLGIGQASATTSLVHQACVKLYRSGTHGWENERHFYAAASKAMRDVLVDDIRRRSRRATASAIRNLDDIAATGQGLDDDTLLDLVHHLDMLREENAIRAEVVDLKFFAGKTTSEIAGMLGVSPRTVSLHWERARAWLYRRVGEGDGNE
ncbi:MAG: ECF-type sigma factor [Pseudomonadota bacterium]